MEKADAEMLTGTGKKVQVLSPLEKLKIQYSGHVMRNKKYSLFHFIKYKRKLKDVAAQVIEKHG